MGNGTTGPMYRPNNRTRIDPHKFSWKDGKKVAVIINIPFEGWSEGAASGIGPMGNVLKPGVLDTNAVSWGMYGAVRGIDRLLDVLDSQKVRASVMVNGVIAELYPEKVSAVASAGHCILAHSYAMDTLPVYLGVEEERSNIQRTTELIKAACGIVPAGWISPRGTPSVNTARLLADAGFAWHGDAYDDDLPYRETYGTRSLIAIPLTMEINDMPLSVRYGNPPSQMVDVFKDSLRWLLGKNKGASTIDITAHTHVYGRPSGAWVLNELIRLAREEKNVWIATRDEISDYVAEYFSRNA